MCVKKLKDHGHYDKYTVGLKYFRYTEFSEF